MKSPIKGIAAYFFGKRKKLKKKVERSSPITFVKSLVDILDPMPEWLDERQKSEAVLANDEKISISVPKDKPKAVKYTEQDIGTLARNLAYLPKNDDYEGPKIVKFDVKSYHQEIKLEWEEGVLKDLDILIKPMYQKMLDLAKDFNITGKRFFDRRHKPY